MCIPWECANERHGCGWRDANGDLHPTFPIYSVRRLVRRLYEGVHARRSVKRRGRYCDKCDWPIGKIGLSYSF